MSQANLGWLFYRDYFRGYNYPLDKKGREAAEPFFTAKNKALYDYQLDDYAKLTDLPTLANVKGFHTLNLVTTYPGLLIGTGYNHDVAAVGAIKIGFYFDHTTGLPVLPGSSFKGILRSVFPGQDLALIADGRPNGEALGKMASQKAAYVRALLKSVGVAPDKVDTAGYVENLEEELFNGHVSRGKGKAAIAMPIPIPQRFICHDAFILKTTGQLLGPDFITPHKSRKAHLPDEVVEPNPVQLVKVMPGVTFQFTFQASTSYSLETGEQRQASLTPEQLTKLVQQILLDQGIGAKTNTGYGQLEEPGKVLAATAAPSVKTGSISREPAKPVSVVERAKAATANYFKGRMTHKKELQMEAEVVKSGHPNSVKIFITEGNTPLADLSGYRAPLEVGLTIKVGVRFRKDLTLDQVAFRGLKN
jgi:CRISPR-associated protein Cmr6